MPRLRAGLIACALASILAAQNLAVARAAARVDTVIPWMTDGFVAADPGQPAPTLPATAVDRSALLDSALARARSEHRPVLWYLPRIEGPQIIRGPIPDDYMRIVAFTDREIAPYIATHAVPLRMACSKALAARTGIKAPDWIEPALVVMDADGKITHRLDRIRTFNAIQLGWWLKNALEPDTDDLGPRQRDPSHPGLVALRAGEFDTAYTMLKQGVGDGATPELLYGLAHAAIRSGRSEEAEEIFFGLVARFPESPEAAQSAAQLTRTFRDTTPSGPAFHLYEDLTTPPVTAWRDATAPSTARVHTAAELDDVVRRGVKFLLSGQTSSGGWTDARYACCPNPRILPNVWTASSAMAMTALLIHRDIDPGRVDAALERGEAWLLDEGSVARGHNEECYADAFRALYLSHCAQRAAAGSDRAAMVRKRMNAIVKELLREQGDDGSFAHEYPNPFATAGVLRGIAGARGAGAIVPASIFERGAAAIAKTRSPAGLFGYYAGAAPGGTNDTAHKDSMARMPACELALLDAGKGDVAALTAAMDNWWTWLHRLERIRVSDYHSDGQLGGFFTWHAIWLASESIGSLPTEVRPAHRKKMLEYVLSIAELDGSFIDSHELGKSYGTAMALLSLANATRTDDRR